MIFVKGLVAHVVYFVFDSPMIADRIEKLTLVVRVRTATDVEPRFDMFVAGALQYDKCAGKRKA